MRLSSSNCNRSHGKPPITLTSQDFVSKWKRVATRREPVDDPRVRAIAQAARELAHKKLDEAVFAAYGWSSDLSDEEILEKLLALNLERIEEN